MCTSRRATVQYWFTLHCHISDLRTHTSDITPHTSLLTAQTSHLTPQTPHFKRDLAPLTSHLTLQTQEPQAIPTKYMSSQGSEKPLGWSSCPQEPLEGFGSPRGAPGGPKEPLGGNLGAPKSGWRRKNDIMQVAATSCFVRDDAARKSLNESKDQLKLICSE